MNYLEYLNPWLSLVYSRSQIHQQHPNISSVRVRFHFKYGYCIFLFLSVLHKFLTLEFTLLMLFNSVKFSPYSIRIANVSIFFFLRTYAHHYPITMVLLLFSNTLAIIAHVLMIDVRLKVYPCVSVSNSGWGEGVTLVSQSLKKWLHRCALLFPPSLDPILCGWTPVAHGLWFQWEGSKKPVLLKDNNHCTPTLWDI